MKSMYSQATREIKGLSFFQNILNCLLVLGVLSACQKQDEASGTAQDSFEEVFEEGFYGFSPTSVSVVWNTPDPWVGYEVYRNLDGVKTTIQTLVSQSRAIGLLPNTFNSLSLYGRDVSGQLSQKVMIRKSLRTWPLFSMSQGVSLREEKFGPAGVTLDLNYNPFAILPPGPGVNALTRAECFISDIRNPGSDQPISDPLAHKRSFLLAQQSLFIGIRDIEFLNTKRVQCQVRYADDTLSISNKVATLQAFRGGEYGACENSVNQEGSYSCQPMVCPPGSSDPASCNTAGPFELTSNSCSAWLSMNSTTGLIEGSPSNLDVESCSFEYALSGLGAADIIARRQHVGINNLQPVLSVHEINGTTPMKQVSSKATIVIRERSPAGSATGVHTTSAANKSFGAVMSSNGTVSLSDAQVESNEEKFARSRGVDTGGRYSVHLGSCESHLNPGSGFRGREFEIDALTGAISFRMREHFYGECEIEIHFDDFTNSETRMASALPLRIRVYPVNDEPKLIFYNGERHNSDPLNVDRCGSKLDSSCLISEEIVRDINISGGILSVPSGLQETNYKEDQAVSIKGTPISRVASGIATAVLFQPEGSDPVARRMDSYCTPSGTNCDLSPGDTLQADDFTLGEAASSSAGSFQVAYTPFNPDVKQVEVEVVFEDGGYPCDEINSLARSGEVICDSANESSLFGTKEFLAKLLIHTGEFMDRYTDFHVVYDSTSMGENTIVSLKATIQEWFDEKLPVLSPKHRGEIFHRISAGGGPISDNGEFNYIDSNGELKNLTNAERWVDMYLDHTLKAAYSTDAALRTAMPDPKTEDLNALRAADGTVITNYRVPLGDAPYDATFNTILSKKKIMLLSFCDETNDRYHSGTMAGRYNSDVSTYQIRDSLMEVQFDAFNHDVENFVRIKNKLASFRGIAFPIVTPGNGRKDLAVQTLAALMGPKVREDNVDSYMGERNLLFTLDQWQKVRSALLSSSNPFKVTPSGWTAPVFDNLEDLGWTGNFSRYYLNGSGRNPSSIPANDPCWSDSDIECYPGARFSDEALDQDVMTLEQFEADMRVLRN